MKNNKRITEIFSVDGGVLPINNHSYGHINDTYFVTVCNKNKEEK